MATQFDAIAIGTGQVGASLAQRLSAAGIGVSIAIAITYLGVDKFFEQLGNVNHLPPAVAAWSPDALFSVAGMYLLLRMRS